MKIKVFILWSLIAVCGMVVLLSGCNSQSYANDLKSEKNLIKDYIKRQGINIITEEPADGAWGANDYLEIADYLYFHLVDAGDTESEEVLSGDKINLRYMRYTLEVPADTVRYWTTNDAPDPVSFKYGQSYYSGAPFCSAWQYAVMHMKHSGAQAKIICPSKLGFEAEQETVTPYGYDLKIQIEKW